MAAKLASHISIIGYGGDVTTSCALLSGRAAIACEDSSTTRCSVVISLIQHSTAFTKREWAVSRESVSHIGLGRVGLGVVRRKPHQERPRPQNNGMEQSCASLWKCRGGVGNATGGSPVNRARSSSRRYIARGVCVNKNISFSAGGDYFGELGQFLNDKSRGKDLALKIAEGLSSAYFMNLVRTFAAMGSLHEEICQIIADLSGRSALLFKYLPIDHIILLVKFYIVQWCTLADMTALIISQGFNLGIDEKDISFGLIARNKHIQESELSGYFQKYKMELDIDGYNNQRNEIIHRGKITDKEVLELKAEWDKLNGRKFSLLHPTPISDEEYQKESSELTTKNFSLGKKLQESYTEHYTKTTALIGDIVRVIARKSIEFVEKGAI